MAANQTITYLTRRFREVGIQPKTMHGQNFLIDLNLLRMLADRPQLDKRDVVLEVGTGTGSLTSHLAERAAHVVTVEIDRQMHQLASEELIEFENVTLLSMDALAGKNHMNPAVLEEVRKHLAVDPERRFKLVANLPYSVATPILSNLLIADPIPVSMTVTIQKELGDRICAAPSTRDYSALSIWMQSQCRAEIVRIMGPTVFWPRPKVHSAIVHIEFDPERRAQVDDLTFFHETVRALFCHRRKFLRSVMVSVMKDRLNKPQVDEVVAEMGFNENTRAEELDVPTLIELCRVLKRKVSECAPATLAP